MSSKCLLSALNNQTDQLLPMPVTNVLTPYDNGSMVGYYEMTDGTVRGSLQPLPNNIHGLYIIDHYDDFSHEYQLYLNSQQLTNTGDTSEVFQTIDGRIGFPDFSKKIVFIPSTTNTVPESLYEYIQRCSRNSQDINLFLTTDSELLNNYDVAVYGKLGGTYTLSIDLNNVPCQYIHIDLVQRPTDKSCFFDYYHLDLIPGETMKYTRSWSGSYCIIDSYFDTLMRFANDQELFASTVVQAIQGSSNIVQECFIADFGAVVGADNPQSFVGVYQTEPIVSILDLTTLNQSYQQLLDMTMYKDMLIVDTPVTF